MKILIEENNLKVEIKFLSNKFDFIRNLFENYLASEIVGVFRLK